MSDQLLTKDQGLPILHWRNVPGYPVKGIGWKDEVTYKERGHSAPWVFCAYQLTNYNPPKVDFLTEPH